MLVQKRARRVKGAGFMDFLGGISNKIGSFVRSPTFQSIKTSVSNFVNTDCWAVVSASKDSAIAGAEGIKNKVVEKITNATATNYSKQVSQDLANYIAQSIANDPQSFRTDPNAFMNAALNEVVAPEPVSQTPITQRLQVTQQLPVTQHKLQDTYGYGIDVRKVNKLLKEVSGRGLAKFN